MIFNNLGTKSLKNLALWKYNLTAVNRLFNSTAEKSRIDYRLLIEKKNEKSRLSTRSKSI